MMPAATKRIEALDFWRGLALAMIFINHMPGNPLTRLTLRVWGFADSAEIFVFLAGFSTAMTLGRKFDRSGWRIGMIDCLRRIWRLFCAHIMLVFGMLAVVALSGYYMDNLPVKQEFNFLPLFLDLDRALVKLAHFSYMPNMADILPLYIVLMTVFPLFWLMQQRARPWPIILSGAVWFYFSGFGFAPAGSNPPTSWQFNPLAWQFLFLLGAAAYQEQERLLILAQRRVWVLAAVLITLASFLAAAPWVTRGEHEFLRVVPGEWLRYDNKIDLSLLRLVHFFAMALLAVRFWPWLQARLAVPVRENLCALGRHSLPVFCAGTMLSLAFYLLQRHAEWGAAGYVALSALGIALLIGLARTADMLRALQRPAMPGSVGGAISKTA